MSGFGDFGTIVQSVDLIFMFLNWTTSLFVVIGALMVRGKRMMRDLLMALLLFAVDSWFLLLFTGGVDMDFPKAWVLMPIVLAVFMSMKIDLYTAQSRIRKSAGSPFRRVPINSQSACASADWMAIPIW